MSLLHTLRKLVDPARFGDEQAEIRVERDRPRREEGAAPPEEAPVLYRCRVCTIEAREPDYCAVCLADTMVALAPPSGLSSRHRRR